MPDIYISQTGDLIDGLETGMSYLSSIVIDNLLNQITSDLYSPDFGTDLKLLPQQNVNSTKEMELKLTLYLQKITDRIKQEQSQFPSVNSEMLDALRLVNIVENPGYSADKTIKRWVATVKIINKAGSEKEIESGI